MSDHTPLQEPQPGSLFSILNMAWVGQGIYTVTALGIPDLLTGESKTVEELAEECHADPVALHQVMRALAGFGIFRFEPGGKVGLTPRGAKLARSESPWLQEYVKLWGEQLYPAGGQMLEMVRTGQVAYGLAHGVPIYEHYRQDPAAGDRFVNFMNAVTDWQRDSLVHAVDVGDADHLVDVGGGRASLLTGLLQIHPQLRGTIMDQPHMKELIEARIRESGLSGRCGFVGGSFLEEVVPDGDLYTIKHVLHDWADEDVVTILRNIRKAMPGHARLIIIEALLDERNGVGRLAKMRDLEQMIWTRGKVRSRAEFDGLLEQAGLTSVEAHATDLPDASLLVCRRMP